MQNLKVLIVVGSLLLGSTVLLMGRWQTMPVTLAQTGNTAGLVFQDGTLWAPLGNLVAALNAKIEEQDGQRVLCRAEQCLLLTDRVVRLQNGVEWMDVVWVTDALGLGSALWPSQAQLSASTESGGLAPDFTLVGLDGASHSLADFRGKKTVAYIWGSW